MIVPTKETLRMVAAVLPANAAVTLTLEATADDLDSLSIRFGGCRRRTVWNGNSFRTAPYVIQSIDFTLETVRFSAQGIDEPTAEELAALDAAPVEVEERKRSTVVL